jgi:hypothetical protein
VTRAIDLLTKAHAHYLRERVAVPVRQTPTESRILISIPREALRFGVTLGWQLARYEFAYDSSLPEARAIAPTLAAEISRALKRDGFPDDVTGVNYHDLVESVLSFYSTSSVGKHAAILLGIASMRATLVGASTSEENNQEMVRIAYSALADADPSALPNKAALFQQLLERKPHSTSEVLGLLDEAVLRTKQTT